VQIAEKIAKSHSSQQKANQSIAETVMQNTGHREDSDWKFRDELFELFFYFCF
jgi:hypothetical protein